MMGDVFIERDIDGWYEQCLLCSHRRELKNIDELKNHTVSVGETRTNSEKA